jgi:hypothetical protein
MEAIARVFVVSLTVYACLGSVFASVFITVLVQRLDPAAEHSGLGFLILIFPGSVALWPLLLKKCLREVTMTADLRRYHRRAWLILAVLLPLLFILARLQ